MELMSLIGVGGSSSSVPRHGAAGSGLGHGSVPHRASPHATARGVSSLDDLKQAEASSTLLALVRNSQTVVNREPCKAPTPPKADPAGKPGDAWLNPSAAEFV